MPMPPDRPNPKSFQPRPQAPQPALPPLPGRALAPRRWRRGRPPRKVGDASWVGRRRASEGLSVVIHAIALLLLFGARLPVAPPPEKPPQVAIEVEFVDIPATKPAQAAAPPPAPKPDPKPPAPVAKPVPDPKPQQQVAAAPKPAAPRVAPPRPAAQVAKPLPIRPAAAPVKRAPTQAELLQRLAAARKAGEESDVAQKLAALQAGAQEADRPAAAPPKPAGRPMVSHDNPLGELSGRGVTQQITPDYPLRAQQQVWEGTVQVRVYVGADGRVERAVVEGSSGYPPLDAAARRAASAYRFTPLPDGETSTQNGVIPFVFVIR